jgi:sterol desaturase/sphingolipid hydroxylase (fatty acid hydroxylase superfamily)
MHYSIHFARLPGSYAAPRRRNHLRHHNSPEARPYGFAIPSSFWDIIGGTSFPEPNRQSAATLRCALTLRVDRLVAARAPMLQDARSFNPPEGCLVSRPTQLTAD